MRVSVELLFARAHNEQRGMLSNTGHSEISARAAHNCESTSSSGRHTSWKLMQVLVRTARRVLECCHCHSSRRAAASQRRLSHRDETHCLPRRAPWRAPVVQEEGQRSCCAGPAVWLKGAAAGAQQQRCRAAQPHHTPAKPRVISRQDLAPKWHFSVHLATWSRPEAPSFWE